MPEKGFSRSRRGGENAPPVPLSVMPRAKHKNVKKKRAEDSP